MRRENIIPKIVLFVWFAPILFLVTGCAILTRDQGTMQRCSSMCGLKGAQEYSHEFSSETGAIKCFCVKKESE